MNHSQRRDKHKVTLQDIQKFHDTLSNHVQSLKPSANAPPPREHDHESKSAAYEYIKKWLKSDLRRYLLSFVPESSEYNPFSELYINCFKIVLQFYFECCTSDYYENLLYCIHALLGYEPPPYQCEIFVRPQYQNQQKIGENSFQFVERRLPSKAMARANYKRNKNRHNGSSALYLTSRTQLAVIDLFYCNLRSIDSQLCSKTGSHRIGVFHVQKLLMILFNAGKNAKSDLLHSFYGRSLQKNLEQWVHQLNEESFGDHFIGDDLTHFTQLFGTLEDLFEKFVKRQSNQHSKVDQDLLNIKLVFVSKLLRCAKMERRVQALSLMKMVLDRARSDDRKNRDSSNDNEWSTKSSRSKSHRKQSTNQKANNSRNNTNHHNQSNHNNNNNHNNAPSSSSMSSLSSSLYPRRDFCSHFILDDKNEILSRLASTEYVHENLLTRMQPIVDVLCESNQINFETIKRLYDASKEKHSIELTQFNKLYLSLSKQLSTPLCGQFWNIIYQRLNDLKTTNKIDESHLEFVAQFTSNYIDSSKGGGNTKGVMSFGSVLFLKEYAIQLEDSGNIISRLELRRFALDQLVGILVSKNSMKGQIVHFVTETLKNVIKYVHNIATHDNQQRELGPKHPPPNGSNFNRSPPRLPTGVDPVDLTYIIKAMTLLLNTKMVGSSTEKMMGQIATLFSNSGMEPNGVRWQPKFGGDRLKSWIDWMVEEMVYWYWYCSPIGYTPQSVDHKKYCQWRDERRMDLRIRFDFIKMIARLTTFVIDDKQIKKLVAIPTMKSPHRFYQKQKPSKTPSGSEGVHHSDLNNFDGSEIEEILSNASKRWQDECVKLNQQLHGRSHGERMMLNKEAMNEIFNAQFDHNMNLHGFRSWLTSFRSVNDGFCTRNGLYKDVPLDVLHPNHNNNNGYLLFKGYQQMWIVIEKAIDQDVVVKMIDELIKVHHAIQPQSTSDQYHRDNRNSHHHHHHRRQQMDRQGLDVQHVEWSYGIKHILEKCTKVFKEYNEKNADRRMAMVEREDLAMEFRTMRYALLLRRCMEYSVGKPFVSSTALGNGKKGQKTQVMWRWKSRNNRSSDRYRGGGNSQSNHNNGNNNGSQSEWKEFDVPFQNDKGQAVNTTMLDIRNHIAKMEKRRNPRTLLIHRKYDNHFVVIEEPVLQYLSYTDLASQKRVELEVSEIGNRQYTSLSWAGHFSDDQYAPFTELRYLLKSNFQTTQLSAYYVLRYIRPPDAWIYEVANRSKEHFNKRKPLMNVFSIDAVRYWVDMVTITPQENSKKCKVIKAMFQKHVFDDLFNLLIDDTFPQSTRGHNDQNNGIQRLFWILQFQRLCYMFWEVEVDKEIFKMNDGRDGSGGRFRLISGYCDRSNEIMEAMVNALDVMLNTTIPTQQLTPFDVTSPKVYETMLAQTIRKCFSTATRLVVNKGTYLHSQQLPKEDCSLEDILLRGLEGLKPILGTVLFGGALAIRTSIHDGIRRFFDDNKNQKGDFLMERHLRRVLGILVGIIPEPATKETKHCARLFELILDLMKMVSPKVTLKFVDPILKYIFAKLEMMDKVQSKKDNLRSLLKCADDLYKMFRPSNIKDIKSRLELLTKKCLFGDITPNITKSKPPEILCAAGTLEKKYAFDLLLKMVKCHQGSDGNLLPDLFDNLARHLDVASKSIEIVEEGDDEEEDRSKNNNKKNGNNSSSNNSNRRRDYVGLANLGCTCYLNSIVQQLFMVPSFTNEILSIEANRETPDGDGDGGGGGGRNGAGTSTSGHSGGYDVNLLYELQRIFLQLKVSQKRFLNPTKFCETVHTSDGRRIDFYEQTDCQEILTALLSQLEQCLRTTVDGDCSGMLDDHFGCKLQYITKCCNGHISKTPSTEKALGMTVQDTSNLEESFAKFTEGEVMAADNAYFCSQCNDKVSAIRRQTIWKPPKQLILNLKRFEWNFETMIRKKINNRFEFEPVINIKEYMTFQFTGDSEDEPEYDGPSTTTKGKNGKKNDNQSKENQYIYDLVGIVVHQGTADRGHYYAFIKNRVGDGGGKEQWYEFNDKNVIKRDYHYIQKEAFGGSDTVKLRDEPSNQQKNNRSNNPWGNKVSRKPKEESVELLSERNAYVLFYEQRAVKLEQKQKMQQRMERERKKMAMQRRENGINAAMMNGDYKEPEFEEKKSDDPVDSEEPWRDIDYLSKQCKAINQENIKLFRQQTLYDEGFVNFMRKIYTKNMKLPQNTNYVKVLTRFVFNVVPIKVTQSKDIKWWWNRLRELVDKPGDDNVDNMGNLMCSKILPSYLMNIFGKHGKADNRVAALMFFEHIIKKVAPIKAKDGMVLDKVLNSLVTVIEEWKPTILTTSMTEIVSMITSIECQSIEDRSYLLNHYNSLLPALKKVLIEDFEYVHELGQNIPDHIWNALPRAQSHLDIHKICDLILKLLHSQSTMGCDGPSNLNNDAFLRSLIARDYGVPQVDVIKFVVKQNSKSDDLECFTKVCQMIHLRLGWLDFYEVWGALHIFNGLFDDNNDPLITDKLNTGCFKTHLTKMVRNLEYFQLSKISILLLAELCKNNALVRSWIQQECYLQLEEIGAFCTKYNKYNPNQRGSGGGRNRRQQQNQLKIKFYRQEKYFEDKDKQNQNKWKKEMNQKYNFKHLNNGQPETLISAFQAINRKD